MADPVVPMDPRRKAMQEALEEDSFGAKENPMGAEMNKLFIDKALFPPDVKEGDKVNILAVVSAVGSKVSITPLEAQMEGAEMEDVEGAEMEAGAGPSPENAVLPDQNSVTT